MRAIMTMIHIFQSTLPAKGATRNIFCLSSPEHISIHAPRGGSDIQSKKWRERPTAFQSTLPAGGATNGSHGKVWWDGISIHAPRGGSDPAPRIAPPNLPNFNPRSPRGERLLMRKQIQQQQYFNPRSPRGERLKSQWIEPTTSAFQSTLPAGGATIMRTVGASPDDVFQSTLPAGGATGESVCIASRRAISIHAPRGGSDGRNSILRGRHENFNPRSPRGERPTAIYFSGSLPNFNPRSPRGERQERMGQEHRYPLFQSTLPAGGAT